VVAHLGSRGYSNSDETAGVVVVVEEVEVVRVWS
jgi:hypothetical protein